MATMRDSVVNGPVELAQPGGGHYRLKAVRQNGKGNSLERKFSIDGAPRAPHASVGVDAM